MSNLKPNTNELAQLVIDKLNGKENDNILLNALKEIAESKYCDYENTNSPVVHYGTGVTDGHRFCAKIARKALEEYEKQKVSNSTPLDVA